MLTGRPFYLWTHKELVYKGRATKLPQDSWQKFDLSSTDLLNLGQANSDGQGTGECSHLFWGRGVRFYLAVFPCTQKHMHTDKCAQGSTIDTKWNSGERGLTGASEEVKNAVHAFPAFYFSAVILNLRRAACSFCTMASQQEGRTLGSLPLFFLARLWKNHLNEGSWVSHININVKSLIKDFYSNCIFS